MKPMDSKTEEFLNQVDSILKKMVGNKLLDGIPPHTLEPLSYKTQRVSGTNYFVKYRINNTDQFVHAKIYRPLRGKPEIEQISGLKKLFDPLSNNSGSLILSY